ncbi:hypothetical protein Bca52824_053337 [Brassica carinata]|uniref:Uncharacterized protein n=1 Tax=Brassica carinata TaxID=52824 RepID=A0A8X7R6B9_BRACI|nr:hypothetical protein Bca52824_053337 [Brassica carinata]
MWGYGPSAPVLGGTYVFASSVYQNRIPHMYLVPGMKGLKRKRPSTGGGVSSRTRARKAVSNGNEPVREESNPVRGTSVVSLSLDPESEGMSAVSSKCVGSNGDEETLLARIIVPEPSIS